MLTLGCIKCSSVPDASSSLADGGAVYRRSRFTSSCILNRKLNENTAVSLGLGSCIGRMLVVLMNKIQFHLPIDHSTMHGLQTPHPLRECSRRMSQTCKKRNQINYIYT